MLVDCTLFVCFSRESKSARIVVEGRGFPLTPLFFKYSPFSVMT